MIIKEIDAYFINETVLRYLLRDRAKRINRGGATVEVFEPRPSVFILALGDHVFRLDIQDFTAQLVDIHDSGETILAAVSEGDNFEEKLASAVISEVIAYF